jgi:hypothetical protein
MTNKSMRLSEPSVTRRAEPLTPTSTSDSQSGTTAVASTTSSPGYQCPSRPWDEKEDASKDLNVPLLGWPKVAKQIANIPDFEAFSSFKDLQIKSLLYYQAELTSLRKELHAAEYADARSGDEDASELARDLDYLFAYQDKKDSKLCKQWPLIVRIREVLKEFSRSIPRSGIGFLLTQEFETDAALLQYSQISALPEADAYNVEQLRVWLRRNDYPIRGPGEYIWGDMTDDEMKPKKLKWQCLLLLRNLFWKPTPKQKKLNLVVPRPGRKVDGLTKWVANEFVPFWQCFLDSTIYRNKGRNSDEEKGRKRSSGSTTTETVCSEIEPNRSLGSEQKTLNTYSEDRMLRFTSAVATVIACLLPTVAIAVLAKLHTTADLLGVIAVFTAIFAMGLMLLTDAGTSRVEIFTATAA